MTVIILRKVDKRHMRLRLSLPLLLSSGTFTGTFGNLVRTTAANGTSRRPSLGGGHRRRRRRRGLSPIGGRNTVV